MMDAYRNVVASIREEISKYYDGEFSDSDSFVTDLRLASDDLSAAALALQKKFGIKLVQSDYRKIHNVYDLAQAILQHLKR